MIINLELFKFLTSHPNEDIRRDEYVSGEEKVSFGATDQLARARGTVEEEPESVDIVHHREGLLLRVSWMKLLKEALFELTWSCRFFRVCKTEEMFARI